MVPNTVPLSERSGANPPQDFVNSASSSNTRTLPASASIASNDSLPETSQRSRRIPSQSIRTLNWADSSLPHGSHPPSEESLDQHQEFATLPRRRADEDPLLILNLIVKEYPGSVRESNLQIEFRRGSPIKMSDYLTEDVYVRLPGLSYCRVLLIIIYVKWQFSITGQMRPLRLSEEITWGMLMECGCANAEGHITWDTVTVYSTYFYHVTLKTLLRLGNTL